MSFITKKQLSRRTVLKGLGVSVALPILDAMVPAGTAYANSVVAESTAKVPFLAIEVVHGSAGASAYGASKNLWSPAATGRAFDLAPTSMRPLEPFREHLTIISNTDCQEGDAKTLSETGGDHFRASAVFLTQAHPKQTEGSDIYCGTSLDQMYAQRFGQDTPIPSMQLSIESVDQSGGCAYGYSCVYMDTISWSSPTQPMPMIRDPRAAFDQLFGVGATAKQRAANRRTQKSILDWITGEVASLKRELSPSDQARLNAYLEDIREIERRIQRIETQNASGVERQLPEAPIGVPDDFAEHMRLMFDLQVVALAADLTRIFSFKTGRDGSSRAYPDSGVTTGFHPSSHHGEKPERIEDFAKINLYYVEQMPHLLEKMKNTPYGDTNLLERSLILYGSSMGNPNVHNHRRCPLFLAGHAGGKLKGGVHLNPPDGTPMANAMLSVAHTLGLDMETFGDSTRPLDLTAV